MKLLIEMQGFGDRSMLLKFYVNVPLADVPALFRI
jgi:hypothetical protein